MPSCSVPRMARAGYTGWVGVVVLNSAQKVSMRLDSEIDVMVGRYELTHAMIRTPRSCIGCPRPRAICGIHTIEKHAWILALIVQSGNNHGKPKRKTSPLTTPILAMESACAVPDGPISKCERSRSRPPSLKLGPSSSKVYCSPERSNEADGVPHKAHVVAVLAKEVIEDSGRCGFVKRLEDGGSTVSPGVSEAEHFLSTAVG